MFLLRNKAMISELSSKSHIISGYVNRALSMRECLVFQIDIFCHNCTKIGCGPTSEMPHEDSLTESHNFCFQSDARKEMP